MKYSIKAVDTYGFKQLDPIPSKSALAEFYATQYYPNAPLSLSDAERKYIHHEAQLALLTIAPRNTEASLLDLGCGPGFFSRELKVLGWQVRACDYARAALASNTPELLLHFIECDIEQYAATGEEKFGLVNLQNVLEHLRDPISMLVNVRRLMTSNSVLRVKVPNDYSAFQHYLISEGYSEPTWVSTPDHVNYFNNGSLKSTFEKLGFKILSIQADFPIEVFQLNPHSNYTKNKALGREAHMARLRASNYLMARSLPLYKQYSEIAAELEYGRQLTVYAAL
jgi:2-polyprenyl-3-methyl-5-hydroxy-6-metoxy-1,4-benzoquinol methylase